MPFFAVKLRLVI